MQPFAHNRETSPFKAPEDQRTNKPTAAINISPVPTVQPTTASQRTAPAPYSLVLPCYSHRPRTHTLQASNMQPTAIRRSASWTLAMASQLSAKPRPPRPTQPRDDGQSRWQNASYGMIMTGPEPQPRDPGNGRRIAGDPQPRDPGVGRHAFVAGPQPRDDGTHKQMSGKPRPPPPPPAPQPRSPGGRRWREPKEPQPRDPGECRAAPCFCTCSQADS